METKTAITKVTEALDMIRRDIALYRERGDTVPDHLFVIEASLVGRAGVLRARSEGLARAKAEGRLKGPPATAKAHTDEVLRLRAEGKSTPEIVRAMSGKAGRTSVYEILRG